MTPVVEYQYWVQFLVNFCLKVTLEGQIRLENGSRCLLARKTVVKIMSRLRDIEIKTSTTDQSDFKITLLKRLKQLLKGAFTNYVCIFGIF